MKIDLLYPTANSAVHHIDNVEFELKGTKVVPRPLQGEAPPAPTVNEKWKGSLEIATISETRGIMMPMAMSYPHFEGLNASGGYIRIPQSPIGPITVDLRNVIRYQASKSEVQLVVQQVPGFVFMEIMTPIEGALTLKMKEKEPELITDPLIRLGIDPKDEPKNRCGNCGSLMTTWLKDKSPACLLCSSVWNSIMMYERSLLAGSFQRDPKAINVLVASIVALTDIVRKSPVRDPLLIAEVDYITAQYFFFVGSFKPSASAGQPVLADDPQSQRNLAFAKSKIEGAYLAAKNAKNTSAESAYGLLLGQIEGVLGNIPRAIQVFEEEGLVQLKEGHLENYFSCMGESLRVYRIAKQYDTLFSKFDYLLSNLQLNKIEMSKNPLLYGKIFAEAIQGAIDSKNETRFNQLLQKLDSITQSAPDANSSLHSYSTKSTLHSYSAMWFEKVGDREKALAEWRTVLELQEKADTRAALWSLAKQKISELGG